MDRSDVIYLVKDTYTINSIGQRVPQKSARMVYCNISSVTGTEWFQGGQNGLKPEYRLTMFRHDYENEEVVNIGGDLIGDEVTGGTFYTVYRTYERKNDELELYVEKRAGS